MGLPGRGDRWAGGPASQRITVAVRRGLDIGEAHLQRARRISCNAGRLAPPAQLFAAAILPGAAAAVSIACPSSSRGPGLSAGTGAPSGSVCLHTPTVPVFVAHASSGIPQTTREKNQ